MITILGSLLITGLLGSIGHCTGMCGPLVLIMGKLISENQPHPLGLHFVYHTSRIAVYVILGALAGLAGSLIGLARHLNILTGTISILLGAGIIILGLVYLGVFSAAWISGRNSWLTRQMSKAIKLGGVRGVIILGALNGLLPCGLVYSALLVAASTANPFIGMLAMLVFGLATVPVLILIGAGISSIRIKYQGILVRVVGIVIVLVGVQQILRGLSTLHVISPLILGGVMLW